MKEYIITFLLFMISVSVCGQALPALTKAADNGDIEAQIFLGTSYYYGEHGVNQDKRKSLQYYRMAAEQGDAVSQYAVSQLYFELRMTSTKDKLIEALEWMRKSADQGYAPAQENLAYHFVFGGLSPLQGYKYAKAAAEQGNPNGKFLIGVCLYQGIGVESNIDAAIKNIKESLVDAPNPEAMYYIGLCYYEKKEYALAKEQYENAISKEYYKAYNDLAYLYAYGYGVQKNMDEAMRMINIVLERYPGNTNYLDSKGEFLLEQKKFDDAKELWKTILQIDSKFAETDSKFAEGMRSLLNINIDNESTMYISEFYLDESDLTANQQGTTVFDNNGNKCALLKIQTLKTGFTFDVGSLGVIKTEQHTGEIWVYVPGGIKRLTIHHPNYTTIKNYTIPVTVQKARTYIVTLVNK